MVDAKLNPTLFEKLTGEDGLTPTFEPGQAELREVNTRLAQRPGTTVNLERYTESALRASVRRELSWLLNTVRLGATQDLSRYPHVRTSVLNYGLPDLTGRSATANARQARARDMETVIRTFEPRLDASSLQVKTKSELSADNAVAYVIHGDISSAAKAVPVQFFANIAIETGEAVVRD